MGVLWRCINAATVMARQCACRVPKSLEFKVLWTISLPGFSSAPAAPCRFDCAGTATAVRSIAAKPALVRRGVNGKMKPVGATNIAREVRRCMQRGRGGGVKQAELRMTTAA